MEREIKYKYMGYISLISFTQATNNKQYWDNRIIGRLNDIKLASVNKKKFKKLNTLQDEAPRCFK